MDAKHTPKGRATGLATRHTSGSISMLAPSKVLRLTTQIAVVETVLWLKQATHTRKEPDEKVALLPKASLAGVVVLSAFLAPIKDLYPQQTTPKRELDKRMEETAKPSDLHWVLWRHTTGGYTETVTLRSGERRVIKGPPEQWYPLNIFSDPVSCRIAAERAIERAAYNPFMKPERQETKVTKGDSWITIDYHLYYNEEEQKKMLTSAYEYYKRSKNEEGRQLAESMPITVKSGAKVTFICVPEGTDPKPTLKGKE